MSKYNLITHHACTIVQQYSRVQQKKPIHQQPTIPPCVYNNRTAVQQKKAKTQRQGDSTDTLSRIERSIVEPM